MRILLPTLLRSSTLLVFFTLLLAASGAAAMPTLMGGGEAEDAVTAQRVEPEPDPRGRETPRGMVSGLVDALSAENFAEAGHFLQADGVAASQARYLKRALDRSGSLYPPVNLSAEPAGRTDDGLAANKEIVGALRTGGGSLDIHAVRVGVGDAKIWRIDRQSLRLASSIGADADLAWPASVVADLPAEPAFFGVALSHWGVLAAFALISFFVAWALTAPRKIIARLVSRTREPNRFERFIEASEPPLRLVIAAIIFSFGADYLGVSIVARYQAAWLVQITGWIAATWFVWRLTDAIADITLARTSQRGQLTAYSTVSFAARIAKGVIAIIFAMFTLRALGVDVTAGLAALGVGGLAIALGAQKLFENLIGSLTLVADRPVKVGDFCRFGDTLGTVEEIGIRSTRVRTLDRTLVTVPNGEFSNKELENYTARDRFRMHHHLGVRYETTPAQMKDLLEGLRKLLCGDPRVDPEPARVRFVKFNAYSLDLELFAYILAEDYDTFLEIQEDLLLQAMELVESHGAQFAFPSQTLYVDGGDASHPMPDRRPFAAR